MKKGLVIIMLCLGVVNLKAQEKRNLVKLSIGLLNKVRLGYEHPVNEKFSYGGNLNVYYGSFPGFKVEPFARFYFGSQCPDGLYAQGRILFGSFKKPGLIYYASDLSTGGIKFQDKSFTSVGGGLDLGYQWLSGKNKNIVIDFSLGIQIMDPSKLNETIDIGGTKYKPENVSFLTTGPGGIFNPHLSIGYAF